MIRITLSLLLLALIAVQSVIARGPIESGTYVIQDINGKYLGVGGIPPRGPLPDLPVRLFEGTSRFVQMWEIEVKKGGDLTISLGRGRPDDYKVIAKGDFVIVSTGKAATVWSVDQTEEKYAMIRSPHSNLVYTSDDFEFQVVLRVDMGLPQQKFRFIRVDRSNEEVLDDQYRSNNRDRELYSSNRFSNLDSWLGGSLCEK